MADPSTTAAQTDPLRVLIERRHPDYDGKKDHWAFLAATYRGGREWFNDHIFKYIKEGPKEYEERVSRAYRFNHTREVVDLVTKYVYKADIVRKEDAPEQIKIFWEEATKGRLPIATFARQLSSLTSTYGRGWIVVDNTLTEDVVTVADAKAAGARVFAYFVSPLDALDMSFDEMNQLNWFLVREWYRDDEDPHSAATDPLPQYRLWTRTGWSLYRETVEVNSVSKEAVKMVVLVKEGTHDLGVVPIIKADHIESEEPYVNTALIDDISYLDRATANYNSNLDAIIQDQTFSQLTIPDQSLSKGEEGGVSAQLTEMGTRRIFTYNAEGGSKPEFISPDVKQASVIVAVIKQIINEIYHSVGMAGERTKQDNSQGIDNSSGVAKAYDFERMNTLLAAKAQTIEHIENEIGRMVMLWHGTKLPPGSASDFVVYPRTFDVRALADEFDIANSLSLMGAPDGVRRKQMETVIDKLFIGEPAAEIVKLKGELAAWPPLPPEPEEPASFAPKKAAE